jgi:pantoate--beta-alanine ligase
MQIIETVAALRDALHLAHSQNRAFVPTMGNLHAGHLHLVALAKQQAKLVIVSIFVNPLQFGAQEDLANYPRTLAADIAKLQAAGVDIVFTPTVAEMYPSVQTMTVHPSAMANRLCGASRTGHFVGVATVVLKLFNMVQPQIAVFGQKDFQQAAIIKDMVQQFNLPIHIISGNTMREADGLAMSSRNAYLTAAERAEAPRLQKVLAEIATQIKQNAGDYSALQARAASQLKEHGWRVDYVEICAAHSLLPAQIDDRDLVIVAAAKLGNTRLIDNCTLTKT